MVYLNHPMDHILTLRCPGAKPHMAVAWDRGSEPIYRSQLWAGDGLRRAALQIDSGHHLVFNPARREDSGTGNCVHQGILRDPSSVHRMGLTLFPFLSCPAGVTAQHGRSLMSVCRFCPLIQPEIHFLLSFFIYCHLH